MSSTIGFASLLAVLLIGLWGQTPFRGLTPSRIPSRILTPSRAAFAQLFFALAAQSCLIYSFIISDYSVLNVYQNSHHLKPLIYKIAGSWGNHEGSMLLLITIVCIYNVAFNFFSQASAKQKELTNKIQSFIAALFAAFTAFSSNPFAKNPEFYKEGLGLNPILQDIGLAIHPPMLYIGYIGVSIVFSYTLACLIDEKINKNFSKNLQTWLYFAFAFLTLGIGLGAWWAYRELGWGGYWFWDPVENVSLMPWLAVITLIHCTKILEKKEIFKVWTCTLAILSFLLSLLGIFLVRSGILTSVHSFAIDAKRGFFVIALLSIIGSLGFFILGKKLPKILPKKEEKINFFSNSGFILINNYFLILALFVVLLGTTYPIFLRGIFNQFIAIGPDYYNKIFSILIIPFLAFLSFSYYYFSKTKIKKLITLLAITTILTSLSYFFKESSNFTQIIILFLAIFACLTSISFLKKSNITMSLAHFGFALVVLGITLSSSFDIQKEVNLKIGETLKIANYEANFENIDYEAGKNFVSRKANFTINKNYNLKPSLRYYPIANQTTNEAAIKHSFFDDLYLVIGNKDEQENYAIRAYYKPFIWTIWLGCFLIFFSTFRIFLKKLRIL